MKPIPPLMVKDGHIVTAAAPARKGMYAGLAGAAALLAAGLGGYWLGQSDGQPATVAVEASLKSAVADAMQTPVQGDEDEKRFLLAQQVQLQQSPETPEQVKARLDRLAADPQALEAHNRNVLNRVTAQAPAQGAAAEIAAAVNAAHQASASSMASEADPGTLLLKAEAAQREAAGRTYTVRAGDTLWAIAARVYGDPHQYPRLFAANPRVLASPDHIFPGQVLRVPS